MILADKIIRLRKKNGWSQEELAEKLQVSRQAVAKWEGAQAVPNLEKILGLGELFGVTTDYLLKDHLEAEEFTAEEADSGQKRITLEEASVFLAWRKKAAVRIAAATFLCILSPVPLFILAGAAECLDGGPSGQLAAGAGLIALLLMVAAAVGIFIFCGFQNAPYEFLEQESFETEYGVAGMVREQQNAYRKSYAAYNILGCCLCIVSPVPLFAGVFTGNELLMVLLLSLTMVVAGVGVFFFILTGVRWASMQKLLKEGDFSAQEKKKSRVKEKAAAIYWLIAAAVFLCWSLLTDDWQTSWILWPVAGILFAGLMVLCDLFTGKNT